jgi:hypothetical protein
MGFPVVPLSEQILGLSDHITRWFSAGSTLLVHLFKNNIVPTPLNVLADYTEVLVGDFPGYAPVAITQSGTPFINGVGNATQIFTDPVFQPSSDPAVPVTIYGYFVTIHPVAGPDTLLYGKRFDVPPIISSGTQAVACDPDNSQVAFSAPTTE